jgi:hypothetical protein
MRITKRSGSIIWAAVAAIVAPLVLMNYPFISAHSSSMVATGRRPTDQVQTPAGASSALSITPVLDTASAATATITSDGGTLTATAANGAIFTLTIPAGAIDDEETITMTPIASISDLPLSGGLAGAVELAPEGLILLKTSTLVIKAPIPIDQQSPFAWYDTGDDFHLYPLTLDVSTLTMTITHLCGYGIGVGTSADKSAVQGHLPSRNQAQVDQIIQGAADTARQKLSQFVAARRNAISPQGGPAKVIKKYNKAVDSELMDLMNSLLGVLDDALAKGDDVSLSCALLAVLDDLNFISQYGFDMGTLLGSVPQYEGKIAEALNKITDNAINRCNGDSENPPNPGEIATVLSWATFANKLAAKDAELAGLGPVAVLMVRRALACANLTFVMNTGVNFMPPLSSLRIFIELDAENETAVKLTPQFDLTGNFNGIFTGTGTLKHQKVGLSGIPDCGVTDSSTDAPLDVESLKLDIQPREAACGSQNAPPLVIASALINVHRPIETFTVSCPDQPPYTANSDLWRANFYCGHQGDSISGSEFKFSKWDQSEDKTTVGIKEYSNLADPAPCMGFKENTTMKVVAGKN